MSEMPSCPVVNGCQCYSDERDPCVCGLTEKALRWWCREGTTQRMTPEQREWCLNEIESVEGYRRGDYEFVADGMLANGVLSAWVDYCRDKGLM